MPKGKPPTFPYLLEGANALVTGADMSSKDLGTINFVLNPASRPADDFALQAASLGTRRDAVMGLGQAWTIRDA